MIMKIKDTTWTDNKTKEMLKTLPVKINEYVYQITKANEIICVIITHIIITEKNETLIGIQNAENPSIYNEVNINEVGRSIFTFEKDAEATLTHKIQNEKFTELKEKIIKATTIDSRFTTPILNECINIIEELYKSQNILKIKHEKEGSCLMTRCPVCNNAVIFNRNVMPISQFCRKCGSYITSPELDWTKEENTIEN